MRDLFVPGLNRCLRLFGLSVVPRTTLLLQYQHDYGSGGYEEYKRLQVLHNKRKLDQVWADEETLERIAVYLKNNLETVQEGICHGTRRGYEQAVFKKLLGCPVIGTEVSDTADQFPDTVQWDFHEERPDWRNRFSFIYTNSLDQAFDPKRALATWALQLDRTGLMFIEHTMAHSPSGASEMDPFGAHPLVMPYLFFVWGKHNYRMVDILEFSHKRKRYVWIFVIRRIDALQLDVS